MSIPGALSSIRDYFFPFAEEKMGSTLKVTVNGREESFPLTSSSPCLDLFKPTPKKPISEVEKEIQTFGLTRTIQRIDQEIGFWGKIETVPDSILQQISLFNLQLASQEKSFKRFPIHYALMSDQEVYSISLRDLPTDSPCEKIVREKLKTLEAEETQYQSQELCVGTLRTLRGAELQQAIGKAPPKALRFLRDGQIEEIQFSRLPSKTIEEFFSYPPERFLLLSAAQLLDVIRKIDKKTLSSIPDGCMPLISTIWDELTHEEKIRCLGNRKTKYQALSPEQLTQLLNQMEPIERLYVPKEALNKVVVHQLKREVIADFFDHPFDDLAIASFQQIPGEELNKALPRLGASLALATPHQLRSIDFTKASKEQIEAVFPSPQPYPDAKHHIDRGPAEQITHRFSWKNGRASLSDDVYQKIIKEQRSKNLVKFLALSELQKKAIRPFLIKDNKDLLDYAI